MLGTYQVCPNLVDIYILTIYEGCHSSAAKLTLREQVAAMCSAATRGSLIIIGNSLLTLNTRGVGVSLTVRPLLFLKQLCPVPCCAELIL